MTVSRRRSIRPLAAAASLALLGAVALSHPAQADRLHAGGIPLSATNAVTGMNIAAGLGNSAHQEMGVTQMGGQMGMPGMGGGHPLVSTNVGVATNVAAGIGNSAGQSVAGSQGGGPLVGLDFSGRGPMVTTNVGVATNVAAGIGNHALQGVDLHQR
jgi:hypothetical protein